MCVVVCGIFDQIEVEDFFVQDDVEVILQVLVDVGQVVYDGNVE